MYKAILKNKDIKPKISNSTNFIEYDWPEIKILSVEYENQCGITIFSYINPIDPVKRLSYYISKRGKDIGGFVTDIIERSPIETYKTNGIHTIVLVGGSTLGLEAICGVQNRILKDNVQWYNNLPEEKRISMKYLPLHERVIGACCYTTNLSIDKNYIYPDRELGTFGMTEIFKIRNRESITNKIYLKQSGVGLNSKVAKINAPNSDDNNWMENCKSAGIGAHFYHNLESGFKILVFINLNSLGVVHDNFKLLHNFNKYAKGTNINNEEISKLLNSFSNNVEGRNTLDNGSPSNTTLSVIITNMIIHTENKELISEELHQEIENMIMPYGTSGDGDILFVCSTDEIEYNKDILLIEGKSCIRNSIKKVFDIDLIGGKYDYKEKYQKYKSKYFNLKKNNFINIL